MSDHLEPDHLEPDEQPPDEQPPAPQARPEGGARRLPLVLASVAAALVMGAAVAAPLVDRAVRGDEEAQRALDLSAVQTYDVTERSHTMLDVLYPQSPPVGGAHAPVWLDCGVYDEPVRNENAVHDLEHGAVWIAHDPDLSAAEVDRLAGHLPDNGIMSPYVGLDAPVVVTVWGAQLALDGVDDERLGLFLEEYGDGHTAPEFGVTCRGGTGDPQGELSDPGTNA